LTEDSSSAAAKTPAGPLAGVRIIDLTSVMMGPYATMILGD
jgi:crotonobetainyl-CoA:carnitine CoA-transferase CaiB-like acyl-CoA transferase